MTTLKLKKPAVPKAPGEVRPPLRGSGAKRPRQTLAEAQAERARRLEEQRAAHPPERERRRESARDQPPRPAAQAARGDRTRSGTASAEGSRKTSLPPSSTVQRSAGRSSPKGPGNRQTTARSGGGTTEVAASALPRLSKRMSELGLASRREADEWIEQGFVRVDGVVVDQLGARVSPDRVITIDPQARLEQARRVTVLLHKPLGYVSGQAEDGHAPAFTLVNAASHWKGDAGSQRFNASQLKHLVPAGRLDLDSSGLLVLTQDGRIARQLIGEDSRIEKEYVVRVAWTAQPEAVALNTAFPAELLQRLRRGLTLDGVALKPAQVSWQNEQHLRIVLREGRKRQIRRMCELVGLQVLALKRIRIGRIGLGELPPGQWRYLAPYESFA
jgi:23S rRNA pseudouridine2604 synthase